MIKNNISNKDLVKIYYEELWNKQNKDYIDILFCDDLIFHGSLGIETFGKSGFEEYMDNILNGIPNLYHGIDTIISEGNKIAVKAIYNGTHKGKLFDYEASNNRIKYYGASFFTFKDGKISQVWVLGDVANLNKQLV